MRYFFLITCFATLPGIAQQYQAHYGTPQVDDAYSIAVTSDNSFILAGSSYVGGDRDAVLMKTNAGGVLQWSNRYGLPGAEMAIYARPFQGGYVFCGESFSTSATGNAFVAVADASGALSWWKEYGGNGYDIAYSVKPLSGGGFIVAGLTERLPVDYDAFLLRTDANGDTLWSHVYGGPSIDHAVQVIQTSDNGFLFCGKMMSYGAGSSDVWLLKTDANGDTLWTTQAGGAGWDEGMDLVETANGYAVCGGTTSSGAGAYDFLLLQFNFAGQLLWTKTYGGAKIEASYSIQQVPSGGFIFAGYTETFGPGHNRGTDSANVWAVRTDLNGDTLWTMAYGGGLKEECFSVVNLPGGGFAYTGYTGSFGDSLQAYIFRADSNGYSSCNERRAYPTVGNPAFSEAHYPVAIYSGLGATAVTVLTTPSAFQQNEICGGPLGVENYAGTKLNVYPNPAGDQLVLEWNAVDPGEVMEISIFNVAGELVRSEKRNYSSRVELNDLALENGVYVLRVHCGEENTVVRVVIFR